MHLLHGSRNRSAHGRLRLHRAFLPLLVAAGAPSAAADVPAAGYSIESLSYPGRAATATLSDGRIVAFDGLRVVLAPEAPPAGGPGRAFGASRILTELPGFVFPSFVVVDPSESFCVVGESLNGELFRVDLQRGGREKVTTLAFNFDAVFEDAGHLLVSAAVRGFGAGNDVLRVELATGVATSIVQVDGASGPVAVTPSGDLLLGTASLSFPAPPGSSDVLHWTAAQVSAGAILSEADATVFGAGFDGASSLAVDFAEGDVFLAENDFATGGNRIFRVGSTRAESEVVVEGTLFHAIGSLELVPGNRGGRFAAFQPRSRGGLLRYNTTDFFSTWSRNAVRTRRPRAGATGPGASAGVGAITWSVTGGPPLGQALVLAGPAASLVQPELPHSLGVPGDPLFLGLPPGLLVPVPGALVSLDASGSGSTTFPNPLGLPDALVLYGLVGDGAVLGVSNRLVL